jgi:hypothetical protein
VYGVVGQADTPRPAQPPELPPETIFRSQPQLHLELSASGAEVSQDVAAGVAHQAGEVHQEVVGEYFGTLRRVS